MVRQGDLLIIAAEQIPQTAVRKNSRVLAEGEATGHKHELTGGLVYEYQGELYFRVSEQEKVSLVHPEHKPVEFTSGEYKVVKQREYVPNGWRNVQD